MNISMIKNLFQIVSTTVCAHRLLSVKICLERQWAICLPSKNARPLTEFFCLENVKKTLSFSSNFFMT